MKTLRTAALSDFLSKVCAVFSKAYSCEKLLNHCSDLKSTQRSERPVKRQMLLTVDSVPPKLMQTVTW